MVSKDYNLYKGPPLLAVSPVQSWSWAGWGSSARAPLPPSSALPHYSSPVLNSPLPPPTEELVLKVDVVGPRPPPSHRRPHPHVEDPPPHKKAHLHEWKSRRKQREKHEEEIGKGNKMLALVYFVLFASPILFHLIFKRVTSDGCKASLGAAACLIWPHVTFNAVCAALMFILTQVVIFSPERLRGIVPASFRSGPAGSAEKWAARWNFINVIIVFSLSLLSHHLERFTDRPLALAELPTGGFVAAPSDKLLCTAGNHSQSKSNGPLFFDELANDKVAQRAREMDNRIDEYSSFAHCIVDKSSDIVEAAAGLEPSCFMFASGDQVVSNADLYFGTTSITMFMLGTLAICISEILKLRYRERYCAEGKVDLSPLLRQNSLLHHCPVFKAMKRQTKQLLEDVKWLNDKFWDTGDEEEHHLLHKMTKAGRAKRAEVKRSLEQLAFAAVRLPYVARTSIGQLSNKANFNAVAWSNVLQAVGFTLWIPLDYINITPCLGTNDRMTAKLFLNIWPDIAGPFGIRYLLCLHIAAACLWIVLGVVVMMSRTRPAVKKNFLVIIYGVLMFYVVEFGDVGYPKYHGSSPIKSLRQFFTPQMLQSVLTAFNIVEGLLRALFIDAVCCKDASPQEQQQYDAQVECDVLDILDRVGDCTKDQRIQKAVSRHAFEISEQLAVARKTRVSIDYQQDLILPVGMACEQPPAGPFHADEDSDDELAELRDHIREQHKHGDHHHDHSHHHHHDHHEDGHSEHRHHHHHHHQHHVGPPTGFVQSDTLAERRPSPNVGNVGQLSIRVIAAHGLTLEQETTRQSPGEIHAYVTLKWDDPKSMMKYGLPQQRTHTVSGGANPRWNRAFLVPVYDWNDCLALEVRDDRSSASLGRVVLRPLRGFPARVPVRIKDHLQSINQIALPGELELEATFTPSDLQLAELEAVQAAERELQDAEIARKNWIERQSSQENAGGPDLQPHDGLHHPELHPNLHAIEEEVSLGAMSVCVVCARALKTPPKEVARGKGKAKSKAKAKGKSQEVQDEGKDIVNAFVSVQLEERHKGSRSPAVKHREPQERTQTINDNSDPVWNSAPISFSIQDWSQELVMEVCNEKGNRFLGRLVVPLFLFRDCIPINTPVRLRDRLQDTAGGELEVVVARLSQPVQAQLSIQECPLHAVSLRGLFLWQMPPSGPQHPHEHPGFSHPHKYDQRVEGAETVEYRFGFPVHVYPVATPSVVPQDSSLQRHGHDLPALGPDRAEQFHSPLIRADIPKAAVPEAARLDASHSPAKSTASTVQHQPPQDRFEIAARPTKYDGRSGSEQLQRGERHASDYADLGGRQSHERAGHDAALASVYIDHNRQLADDHIQHIDHQTLHARDPAEIRGRSGNADAHVEDSSHSLHAADQLAADEALARALQTDHGAHETSGGLSELDMANLFKGGKAPPTTILRDDSHDYAHPDNRGKMSGGLASSTVPIGGGTTSPTGPSAFSGLGASSEMHDVHEDLHAMINNVKGLTGVDDEMARILLEEHGWNEQAAVNAFFDQMS